MTCALAGIGARIGLEGEGRDLAARAAEGALADLCAVIPRLSLGGILVFDDIAHPDHPYLLQVWRTALAQYPGLSGYEFTELGYGVAFAIRQR